MSESIAFMETHFLIRYMGFRMQQLNTKLYVDIKHKYDLTHIFSDAYDLVQGCALYLCKHFGKHLTHIIGYTKKK